MLVVAQARARGRGEARFSTKWDLTAAVIGEVIAEPVYRVTEGDRVVAEFPGSRLVTDCPDLYARRRARATRSSRCARATSQQSPSAPKSAIRRGRSCELLSSPDDREQGVGVPAVRHDRAHEYRHRSGRRRGGAAHSRHAARRSRSRRTATAATCTSTRAPAAESPSPRRRATSPAPARARWRSRTA